MYRVLDSRVFLVTGEKVAALLHGQLSNSINDLAVDTANYNLLLTLKGKVVADLYVYRAELGFFCIVSQNFYDVVKNQIVKLAPLSHCVVSDTQKIVLHVIGNEFELTGMSVLIFRNTRFGEAGVDVLFDHNEQEKLFAVLKERAIKEFSDHDMALKRIKNGVPLVGQDVTEKNLPQEARLDHALNFGKGCYLGQEVIARLHYRGHVNKVLTRLVGDGSGFSAGEGIFCDGQKCGEITSVAHDQNENKTYMLGYVPYNLTMRTTFFVSNQLVLHHASRMTHDA